MTALSTIAAFWLVIPRPTPVHDQNASVSAAERDQTVSALIKEFRARYVFPDLANKGADSLKSHSDAHDYDSVTDGAALAKLLTDQLHLVADDHHLRVRYSPEKLPPREAPSAPTADEIKRDRLFTHQVNAGLDAVRRLDGNVGYIEIRGFFDPEIAAGPIAASFNFVANTDALIIDLRRNGGGDPETVRRFCSYLFDTTPVHLNDLFFRATGKADEFWTLKSVQGKRYLNRKVYVLIGKRTASGGEECAYDLQNIKRGLLIGESTWGGANPGDSVRLSDHFTAFIPVGRAINPYTHKNWEGTGVIPDIAATPQDGLKVAHLLALRDLLAVATDPDEKTRLTGAIEAVEKGGD